MRTAYRAPIRGGLGLEFQERVIGLAQSPQALTWDGERVELEGDANAAYSFGVGF